MKKCVVFFQLFDKRLGTHITSTKFYNNSLVACKCVLDYVERIRIDKKWLSRTMEDELVSQRYKNAIAVFLGADPDKKYPPDLIAIFLVEPQDGDGSLDDTEELKGRKNICKELFTRCYAKSEDSDCAKCKIKPVCEEERAQWLD